MIIRRFVEGNKEFFEFLPAEEVHPHDHLLYKICLRFLPAGLTPNMITIFRFAFTPVVFGLVWSGCYGYSFFVFCFMALTDAFDGSLARVRGQVTRFGMLIDPAADKFLIGGMVLLLVFQHLHFLLGIAILWLEIAFVTLALVARIKFKTIRMANMWGKIKMVLQVVAVGFVLLALTFDTPLFFTLATWIFGLAIGFAVVSLFKQGI